MNILVIGAGRGLGEVLVRMLLARGHKVAAGYRALSEASCPAGALAIQTDVCEEAQMIEAGKTILARIGPLDAVVDVAGILPQADRDCTLMDEPIDEIIRQINVNAVGVLIAFRSLYPAMKDGSRFFAVTSEGGSFTLAGTLFPAYSISKTAANKIVQVLRMTCGSEPVDLIAVHPGRMNTEMGRTTAQIEPEEAAEGFIDLLEGRTPINSSKNWFIDYLGRPMPV